MDLSIIMPAYNAKESICTTLDSIKNQNLSISFEVIIVNDCSDYNYNDIVNKYKSFFTIKELKTPSNIGPGGARQYGIDNSKSTYITFVDSDDYFYKEDSISNMYQTINNSNSDILISNFLYKRDNQTIVKKENAAWLHGKMYKREFLEKHNIRFNNTRANEDNGFNRLILLLEPKYVCLDETVYVYNENPESITRKNNRSYKFTGIEGFCYNMNWAMDEYLLRCNNTIEIGPLSLDILMTLYIYYLGLEQDYNVNKILEWAKPIKEKYYKYQLSINKDIYPVLLDKKKEFLKDEYIIKDYHISFEEFLNKI